MNNRIDTLFQDKQEKILSVYFTAGYPDLEDTCDIIRYLDKSGVDLIEVGFPFSDPLADGPTIQQSNQQAIHNGMTLNILFEQLEELRKFTEIPVILMGYLNPVLQFGEDIFIERCKAVGINGLVLPDMPLDYFEDCLKKKFGAAGLFNILLITPETSEERIRKIDSLSSGFLYMVSSNSITGSNKDISLQQAYFKRIKEMQLQNPHLIGFGVHDNETFKSVCQYSNGAIIGSAFIKYIKKNGTSQTAISNFINSIRL